MHNSGFIPLSLAIALFVCSCSGGGESSPAETAPVSTIAWNAPVSNTDGSQINDLVGYRLYYGTTSGVYTGHIDIASSSTRFSFADLAAIVPVRGTTYYIVITAYDGSMNESASSNEMSIAF